VTKIQAAENDLKQLMAEVTRTIEKAQQAVARICTATATGMDGSALPSSKTIQST
jgi:hypothetical protein